MLERTGFLEDLRRANLNTGSIPVLTMGSCASVAGSSPTGEQLAESMSPPTLQGGSFQDYHNGLKHLSGMPAADLSDKFLIQQMEAEHCSMRGCDKEFDCSSHYEKWKDIVPCTTAQEEWKYVKCDQEAKPKYLKVHKLKGMYQKEDIAGRKADIYRSPSQHVHKDRLGRPVLSDPERLGLALYTGPMFQVYNNILRRHILKKGDEAQKIIDIFVGAEKDPHLAAEQKDEVLNGYHAEPPPSTLVGSYKALSSVYTSAEILKVDVFDKFDLDGNFRINRAEVNTVLSSLLSKGQLDDSMMRVVDYFCIVDQNSDGVIDFVEVLKHCFPYISKEQLDNLSEWLHPTQNQSALEDLTAYAKTIEKDRVYKEGEFKKILAELRCEYEASVRATARDKDAADRIKEFACLKKGFVCNSALTKTLAKCHHDEKFKKQVEESMLKMRIEQETDHADSMGPNLFPVTIFAIQSAIQKLSRHQFLSPVRSGNSCTKFYRGFHGIQVTKDFQGYCEMGFMSASRSPKTAEEYSFKGDLPHSLILEIEAPLDGFANIREYSQFPHEEELIFAPLAYVKFNEQILEPETVIVNGKKIAKKHKVSVYPCPSPTIDGLREQEQCMHLQLFLFNRSELSQSLEMRLKKWALAHNVKENSSLDELCHACDKLAHVSSPSSGAEKAILMKRSISTRQIIERILFQYDEVFSKHERSDPLNFSKDDFFRETTADMLDSKLWCEHKLELWLQNREDRSDLSLGIYFYPLQQCFRIWIMNLRSKIDELRHPIFGLAQQSEMPSKPLKQLCLDLLKAKGRIPSSHELDSNDDTLFSCLESAAVSSWGEEDVLALLDLGCDITKHIPDKHTTCLHIAAAHGNNFFLETVFNRQCRRQWGNDKSRWVHLSPDVVHIQDGETHTGETPLYLAAENGHSSCIEVLLSFCPQLPEILSHSPLVGAIAKSHVSCVKLLVDPRADTRAKLINLPSNGFTPLMRAVSRGHIGIVELLLHAGADPQITFTVSHSTKEGTVDTTFSVEQMLKQSGHDQATTAQIEELLKKREQAGTLEKFKALFAPTSK